MKKLTIYFIILFQFVSIFAADLKGLWMLDSFGFPADYTTRKEYSWGNDLFISDFNSFYIDSENNSDFICFSDFGKNEVIDLSETDEKYILTFKFRDGKNYTLIFKKLSEYEIILDNGSSCTFYSKENIKRFFRIASPYQPNATIIKGKINCKYTIMDFSNTVILGTIKKNKAVEIIGISNKSEDDLCKEDKLYYVRISDANIKNLNEEYFSKQGLIGEEPYVYTYIEGKYLDFDESLIK